MSVRWGGRGPGHLSRWPKATSSGPTLADILGAKLLADWDAEVASSLTLSGSTVTTWTDLVAGYAATQAFASQKPLINATAINGRPAVVADGTDDYLEPAVFPAGLPTGSDPCEMWALVSQNALAADTANRRVGGYGSTAASGQRVILRSSDGSVNRFRVTTGNNVTTEGTVDFTGVHVVRGITTGTGIIAEIDGVASSEVAVVPNTGNTIFRLFADRTSTPTLFWLGAINRFMVTDLLDTDEATFIRNYLKARGGIA